MLNSFNLINPSSTVIRLPHQRLQFSMAQHRHPHHPPLPRVPSHPPSSHLNHIHRYPSPMNKLLPFAPKYMPSNLSHEVFPYRQTYKMPFVFRIRPSLGWRNFWVDRILLHESLIALSRSKRRVRAMSKERKRMSLWTRRICLKVPLWRRTSILGYTLIIPIDTLSPTSDTDLVWTPKSSRQSSRGSLFHPLCLLVLTHTKSSMKETVS